MTKKNIFSQFPSTPGVYLFQGARGKILYIGKAANLKARLASYKHTGRLNAAKRRMVNTAKKIETRSTESEIEALILETLLIKKHQPQYNILMRDDKNYAFIGFTKETYPRVFVTHQPVGAKTQFIGPFTSVTPLKEVLKLLRGAFPYCTCAQKTKHARMCLNSEIGKCMGYCCVGEKLQKKLREKTSNEEKGARKIYRQNIRAIRTVLLGNRVTLLMKLKREMLIESKRRRYERAALLRDQIQSLEQIFAHKRYVRKDLPTDRAKALRALKKIAGLKYIPTRIEGYDISNIQGKNAVSSMVVFADGIPEKSSYRRFQIRTIRGANDPAMIYETLTRRLLHPEWPLADFLLIDGGRPQLTAAQNALLIYNKQLPVGALAKRAEELYLPHKKKPIPLTSMPPALLHLLQHIRNEAHRFAVSYHRKKRTRSLFGKKNIN